MIGTALAVAIGSHLLLDWMTHAPDIPLAPLAESKFGLGLYTVPALAMVVETLYGVFCWWIYRGGYALLFTILGFNLANASFFLAAVHGPEALLAGRPSWLAVAVLVQIVVTLGLVGRFSRPRRSIPSQRNLMPVRR